LLRTGYISVVRQSILIRIAVILTLVLGTAGLRSIHIATAHCHEKQSISEVCDHHQGHDHESGHNQESSNKTHSHTDTDGQDEQSCDTCATLLALACQTTDAPALVLKERICERVIVTTIVAPADCALGANRARPPPISSIGV